MHNWHNIDLFVHCVKSLETEKEPSASICQWPANHYGDLLINVGQKIKFQLNTIIIQEEEISNFYMVVERYSKKKTTFFFMREARSQIPLWDQWLTVTLLLNWVQKEHYCIRS